MHTQLHNKNNFGFKPNRLANFEFGKFPVLGAVPGAIDGATNLLKTAGYAITQGVIGVRKATWDLIGRDMIWKNGIRNWGLEDALTLGITKAGKIVTGGVGNLIDPQRSAIHHIFQAGFGTAAYTAGSVLQPVAGFSVGHHLRFDPPVATQLTNATNRTVAGTSTLAKKISGGAQPAAAAA